MDEQFGFLDYKVNYKAKLHTVKEQSEVHPLKNSIVVKSKDRACFSDISFYMFYNAEYTTDIDVKFYIQDLNEEYSLNHSILSHEQIKEWIKYLSYLFNTDLVLTKRLDTYHVKINMTAKRSKLVLLLTMIRFLFEFPFMNCLYMAFIYKEKNKDLSLLYILNQIFTIYDRLRHLQQCHYYYQADRAPKELTDEEYNYIINNFDAYNPCSYCIKWSEKTFSNKDKAEIMDLIYKNGEENNISKKNLHAMAKSFDSLLDGSLYNVIEKVLNNLINNQNND